MYLPIGRYVIEFQKRSLPHMHLLAYDSKITTPEIVYTYLDKFISAEIPDAQFIARNCSKNMIHGP